MAATNDKSLDPSPAVAARRAPRGARVPMIREAWYVVGGRDEFDHTLKQRRILGQPVVFYEATDGSPIVLDDRCAHRQFPLSRSHLEDDVIRCGYHGFRYDSTGQCVFVPGADPGRISVRSYPAVVCGPWVWVWTGDNAAEADPDDIPWPSSELVDGDWVTGYTNNPANFALVHENLLDLTHLEYLHGVGNPEFTTTPPKLLSPDELPERFRDWAVGYGKDLQTTLAQHAMAAGEDPAARVTRHGRMLAATPAISYAISDFTPEDPDAVQLRKLAMVHCLTPIDESSTHQFWAFWQDVPLKVSAAEYRTFVDNVFAEDVEALRWVEEYVKGDDREGVVEHSVPADVPGLRLRRALHRSAGVEARR